MPLRATPTTSAYLAALSERVLVFDGAMGTSLQALNPTHDDFGGAALEGWIDGLVLHAPHLVETVHRSFLDAGADVVETCTFQATPLRCREWGPEFEDRAEELNRSAAQLARGVCDAAAADGRPRFVAGSMGPTGFLPSSDDPSLANISFGALVEAFRVQARGLVDGGADLLVIETAQDILEVKAAMHGCRAAFADLGRAVPLQTQVTLDVSGRMLLGTDIDASLTILDALGADIIGLNCSTGPEHMREPIRHLCSHTRRPVSCIPNAGLPLNVDGEAVFPLGPEPMAIALEYFVSQLGVNAVGGCCGSTPDHIRALVARVAGAAPLARHDVDTSPRLASAIRGQGLLQEPRPLLIGERVNSQGSRAMKRLLLADDYDGVLAVARDQVEAGAHALDVCVALTERSDEAAQMRRTVKTLQMSVELPLVIDTTEADVLEAALEAYPGRAIVNSINLEGGRARIDAYLPLVRDHGACVIALCIDDDIGGMAKTAATKLAVAKRITTIAVEEYGLQPYQLLFDALTFTLATGQEEFLDSARETIEGIRAIKREIPGVLTTLGLSNVSFGLPAAARPLINSVFLHYCLEAGLDTVIINPAHVLPWGSIDAEDRVLAEDLVLNRRPDALARLIDHAQARGEVGTVEERADPFDGLAPAERIHQQILHRRKEGIEDLVEAALTEGRTAVEVLNDVLLPAMKDVGDRFGAGELILPFVLQSAEVMKRAVAQVETHLDRQDGATKGTVVLATVYGDVHDIGKNLVATILGNNGYTVVDLGKQVPVNTILDRAVEVDADVVGLSALLVSTSRQMPLVLKEMDARGMKLPVVVGGAAINRPFGRRILYIDGERIFEPGVFYCRDAFEGLETVDQLVEPERREPLVVRIRDEAAVHRVREAEKAERLEMEAAAAGPLPARSAVPTDAPIPSAPFLGPRVIEAIDLRSVVPCIDRVSLFKLSWGYKGERYRDKSVWEREVRETLEPRLELSLREAEESGYIRLQAVYGYWPALADGDDILVYHPVDQQRVIGRFHFPRQQTPTRLCLSDYIRPRDLAQPGEHDVIALQVVTAGPGASERSDRLKNEGAYDDMLRVHGFSTQLAEATAEWVHRRIRTELGIPSEQGRRYSWGYPACPDLEGHRQVFDLLPTDSIGVGLTTAWQLDPEQSTAAIVLNHPQARYFDVRGAKWSTADPDTGSPSAGAPED